MFVFVFVLGRPKRLFIFMNPFGGNKNASKIFLDSVKPLLEDADIQFTLEGFVLLTLSGFNRR